MKVELENMDVNAMELKKRRIEKLLNTKTYLRSITKEDADSLSIAAQIMSKMDRDNDREIAIIDYHARNMCAVLMRDEYTIRALKEALECVNLHIEKMKRQ